MRNFRISVLVGAAVLSAGLAFADAPAAPSPDNSGFSAPPAEQATSGDVDAVQDAPDVPNATGPIDQRGTVAVGEINVFDGEPVGLLTDASGGLGRDMWINSSRQEIETLLKAIPITSSDKTIRGLARRVLLTESESPVGSGKRALLTIRIEKLLKAGGVEEAGALAIKARLPHDPDFARVQTEAILLAGDVADACGDATAERLSNGDLFWLELRGYCFAASGDQEQTDLVDQVIEAQGDTDEAYRTLRDDAVQHLNYMPGEIPNATSLHVFLLKAAGLPVPKELVSKFRLAAKPIPAPDRVNGYLSTPADLSAAAKSFSPRAKADANTQRRAALIIGLNDALGTPLTPDVQAVVPQAETMQWFGARPSADEIAKIDEAASQQGRRGEAVLRIIEALNERDIGAMAPDAVVYFVRKLRQLGLADDAGSVALTAMKAYRDPPPPPPVPAAK
jgi:hypothetical protein